MYIIDEENHASIAVVRNPFKAIEWLVDSDWLTPYTEGWHGDKIEMWELIHEKLGYSEDECKTQPRLIEKFFETLSFDELFDYLGMFGFSLDTIVDIDEED